MMRRCTHTFTNVSAKVVFVLGGPGSGKGTQSELIVREYDFVHLSAGELLRREQARPKSEFKELIEHHMKEGTIVPAEITCSLLKRAILESNNENFLIDGYPRNRDNLVTWHRIMGDLTRVLCVLHLECPLDVCVARCLARGVAGSGRADDNRKSMEKRIEVFLKETTPLMLYYENLGLLRKINGDDVETRVFEGIKVALNSVLKENR